VANNNNIPTVNSADTLSLFFRPGEDKRLFNTNSDSIFTFGDFRIYRDNSTQALTSDTLSLSFDSFSTLESLGASKFTPPQSYYVNYNELKLPANDPFSYSYFGSFYTEVADSINRIVGDFPYALLSYDGSSGITIYDYVTSFNNITGERRATFKVPYSAIINQGNIIVNSGSTISGAMSLVDNYTGFSIQMSAQTSASTIVADIIAYNFSAGTGAYLEFTINDFLEYVSGSTSTFPVYIRPTRQRMAEYKMNISKLEYNLLYGEKLMVPNVETDTSETEQTFVWPTSIDGFNPDSYGVNFEDYKKSILKSAGDIDDAKTNIMIKTMIPENFLEMDSDGEVYRKTIQAYAHEFDQLKHYIDGIAYAHSLEYSGEESLPQKFMYKFSNLLGWKLSDAFSEIDLFEYLAGDADGQGNSYSQFNIEIWKRILININWLYKKKGTRDALQFLFKLLGAPECLVDFDEFVYKINRVGSNSSNTAFTNSIKVNDNGYVQYAQSIYAFQEGGTGRGDGQKYIYQWTPEFTPDKQVDNIKTVVGDLSVFGSEDTMNTKEVCIALSPAAAIECDVFAFYKSSGTCWEWGSGSPPFSANTVPFEFTVDCDNVKPEGMSAMTLSQWLNFVYANSINPRNRKTIGLPLTMSIYPQLRNAYLNYYYWSSPPSNRLTFHRLQGFLDLIESNFTDYTLQLLPATTILQCQGTTIKNTVFNRQKFVYKEGINDGSEFRVSLPNYEDSLNPIEINSAINDYLHATLTPVTVIGTYNPGLGSNMSPYQITAQVTTGLKASIEGYEVAAEMQISASISKIVGPPIAVASSSYSL
jgi:hypothetical protein